MPNLFARLISSRQLFRTSVLFLPFWSQARETPLEMGSRRCGLRMTLIRCRLLNQRPTRPITKHMEANTAWRRLIRYPGIHCSTSMYSCLERLA